MPYDPPTTSTSETQRYVGAQYGNSGLIRVTATITVDSGASETETDEALQLLVDTFTANSHFSAIYGAKNFQSNETQTMEPTA